MRELWADPAFRQRVVDGRRRAKPVARARFSANVAGENATAWELRAEHPAVLTARSIFNVTRPAPLGSHVLISGVNQRKIGHRIVKGPWSGLPVYTLSLEERATCPSSCKVWRGCYGNAMPFAARWAHGAEFERTLLADAFWLAGRHKGRGFAVRLHVLGDFYSTAYVELWATLLAAIPRLHVWGYTAHARASDIGAAAGTLNARFPERCHIRFSGADTIVIRTKAEAENAIICPAETGATANCGSCGLCWAPAARDKAVAFLFHGNPGRRAAA
jgi:hypothetical protein